MKICPSDKCTGCAACMEICPNGCISMKEDSLGTVHPAIDNAACTNCGLCVKTCPNNVALEFRYPKRCYASWITDNEKREICASGGIGTIMSEYVIKQGGVVFGSRYDEKLTPIMSYAETLEELEYYKGSRYVQSLVRMSLFKKARKFLIEGRQVLFVGTPCQIAGLKTFLRKEYANLITVDLICHGVCPTKYLGEEICFLKQKYNLDDISDIRFRGNDGNNYHLSLWKDRWKLFPRNNYLKETFYFPKPQQYYLTGFLMGISLRENCYTCNYSRPERISDITIGDFIGLGNEIPFGYAKENVSSVTVNTDKGTKFYDAVSSASKDLLNVERDYKERLVYKPSLVYPYPRHELNEKFNRLYSKIGYTRAIRKVLRYHMIKQKIKYFLSFPKLVLWLIYKHIR